MNNKMRKYLILFLKIYEHSIRKSSTEEAAILVFLLETY